MKSPLEEAATIIRAHHGSSLILTRGAGGPWLARIVTSQHVVTSPHPQPGTILGEGRSAEDPSDAVRQACDQIRERARRQWEEAGKYMRSIGEEP